MCFNPSGILTRLNASGWTLQELEVFIIFTGGSCNDSMNNLSGGLSLSALAWSPFLDLWGSCKRIGGVDLCPPLEHGIKKDVARLIGLNLDPCDASLKVCLLIEARSDWIGPLDIETYWLSPKWGRQVLQGALYCQQTLLILLHFPSPPLCWLHNRLGSLSCLATLLGILLAENTKHML